MAVITVLGFNAPQLLAVHDASQVLEMTIVKRPFALDFAGAYLDVCHFPSTARTLPGCFAVIARGRCAAINVNYYSTAAAPAVTWLANWTRCPV